MRGGAGLEGYALYETLITELSAAPLPSTRRRVKVKPLRGRSASLREP